MEVLHGGISPATRGNVVERFAPRASRRPDLEAIRDEESYYIYAYPSDKGAIKFWAGFWLLAPDGYPMAEVGAHADFGAAESIAALRRMAGLEGWEGYNLDEPDETLEEPRVSREMSLALALSEEDHVAAVQRFFVKSLDQFGAELAAFNKERPDLPWAGE